MPLTAKPRLALGAHFDGDAAVATGWSSYKDSTDGPVSRTYDNCFVMRFAEDGRCREFTEWFMRRRPEA